MKLLVISKTVQLEDYKNNIQNYTTWKEMGKYFDQIYIIIQSPRFKHHKAIYDNLNVYWLPKTIEPLNYILFNIESTILGMILTLKKRIDVLNGELPALIIKKLTRKSLILQIQGQLLNLPIIGYSRFKRWYIRKTTKYICKHANKIRVVSKEIAESVKKEGIDESKIFVIPSRCNTTEFDKNLFKTSKSEKRKEFGFSDEDTVLIFVGRLIFAKDVSSILQAFKYLREYSIHIKLLIVGDGILKESLQQEAKNLQIWDNIIFYGNVEYKKIPEMLACSDIFLSPSIDEGMPRSVLEAQSMSLPVITTSVGGNAEIVKNMETGILVQTRNPQQIADVVKYLINNPKVANKIGDNARNYVVNNHDFNSCIKFFAEMMQN